MKDYNITVTILESITDAIFILNSEEKIEYANHSAQNYLEIPFEEIIGKSIGSFISSEDYESLKSMRNESFTADDSTKNDYDMFSKSEAVLHRVHENIPVLLNVSSIPDSRGEPKYYIVTAKEITYQKTLEKELRGRQALSSSYDRLKALGEMSVGLVHSLGQPVTSLGLRLDQMSKLKGAQVVQKHVNELRKDVDRISGTINKIRNYALAMSEQQKSSIDLNQILRSALQILEYEYRGVGITIELNFGDDLPNIDANEPELEQALINILMNAAHAFRENNISGNRVVTISSEAVENKWVSIQVEDNAGGIPKSLVPKIFEPFFTTWDRDHHAGTGLSVSRDLLTSLGGDLNFKPARDGSRFVVRIPISQSEERTQLVNLIELLNS